MHRLSATWILWCGSALACGGGASLAGDGDGGDGGTVEDGAPDPGPDASDEAGGEEDGASGETEAEFFGDGFVLDAAGWEASEYVVLPPESGCGDGVLDPGEECDDRNRLNGDGCDWLCRLGDGDPPPEPDPDAPDYVPAGDAVALPDSEIAGSAIERLPLAWTGSEFATAWFQPPGVDGEPGLIRFRRFDAAGRSIDAEWRMPSVWSSGGMEVVWNGDGYGLFFVDVATGLWYLRLDAHGKPMGDPVLIEGDTQARAPAADLAPDGTYVVAWMHESTATTGGSGVCSYDSPDITRVRRVTLEGATPGPVVTVDESGQGFPDIATGAGGFGLAISVQGEAPEGSCAFRFLRLDETLESAVSSGVLGRLFWGDVKWLAAESRYVTAWAGPGEESESTGDELRVAFFEPDGVLAGPPVRNATDAPRWSMDRPVRIAAGDGGLSLVAAWNSDHRFSYLRTDAHGVAVAGLRDVRPTDTEEELLRYAAYDAVWTDVGFAVLFSDDTWPEEEHLYLRHFVRAE